MSGPTEIVPAPALIGFHEQFPEENGTDLVIISSDGVSFHLHRKYLEATTGSFPGPEIDTGGEPTFLSEPANVLALLFQFVRPARHPTLRSLEFDLLAPLAEAANKYEVFAAMNICEVRLIENVATHPREILVHGIKHDYPILIATASQKLARAPLLSILSYLPVQSLTPWIEYQEAWKSIFKDTMEKCVKANVQICESCRASLIVWVTELEAIDSIKTLNATLARAPDLKLNLCSAPLISPHGTPRRYQTLLCGQFSADALAMTSKMLKDRIKAVPSFVQFLKGKRQRND